LPLALIPLWWNYIPGLRISCLKAVDDFPEQCDIHLQDNDDLVNKYKKGIVRMTQDAEKGLMSDKNPQGHSDFRGALLY